MNRTVKQFALAAQLSETTMPGASLTDGQMRQRVSFHKPVS
jgi:hypothetical protein